MRTMTGVSSAWVAASYATPSAVWSVGTSRYRPGPAGSVTATVRPVRARVAGAGSTTEPCARGRRGRRRAPPGDDDAGAAPPVPARRSGRVDGRLRVGSSNRPLLDGRRGRGGRRDRRRRAGRRGGGSATGRGLGARRRARGSGGPTGLGAGGPGSRAGPGSAGRRGRGRVRRGAMAPAWRSARGAARRRWRVEQDRVPAEPDLRAGRDRRGVAAGTGIVSWVFVAAIGSVSRRRASRTSAPRSRATGRAAGRGPRGGARACLRRRLAPRWRVTPPRDTSDR